MMEFVNGFWMPSQLYEMDKNNPAMFQSPPTRYDIPFIMAIYPY
jgi:hypothetical protein